MPSHLESFRKKSFFTLWVVFSNIGRIYFFNNSIKSFITNIWNIRNDRRITFYQFVPVIISWWKLFTLPIIFIYKRFKVWYCLQFFPIPFWLNFSSAGVFYTPIHTEGGETKMLHPSNFCFKYPIKVKLGMYDHHDKLSWVTEFCWDLSLHSLLRSSNFYTLGGNGHMSKSLFLIVQSPYFFIISPYNNLR